jgi:hypothetical protein
MCHINLSGGLTMTRRTTPTRAGPKVAPARGYEDEYGFVAPSRLSSNQRRVPPEDFPTGPEIGERLPDFTLPDQTGRKVRFHEDRGSSRAAVVFYRSAVW